LYKEDFQKFADAFKESIEYIEERQPYTPREKNDELSDDSFSNIEFEDLEK
jgi:hypothetical protein